MNWKPLFIMSGALPALLLGGLAMAPIRADEDAGANLKSRNDAGILATVTSEGHIDTRNPFFKSLGTNGRACVDCHQPSDGWSITPYKLKTLFDSTHGADPVFRLVDGANSPTADVSSEGARRRAYSMLLTKGLIRVGLPIPANAEFELADVNDPYGYASAAELSLFRRPLPSTNLRFLTGVMWDGREGTGPFTLANPDPAKTLHDSLANQANDATLGHAQGAQPLTTAQREQIVAFEMALTTAQKFDNEAGMLDEDGATGGPDNLSLLDFGIGINDPVNPNFGNDPTHPFNPLFVKSAMTLYTGWDPIPQGEYRHSRKRENARAAIVRGERLFNSKPISITGVAGLNDVLGVATIPGTCTTCHNTPIVGNHSVTLPIDIGLTDASRRTPDMPLYTLRNKTTNPLPRRQTQAGRSSPVSGPTSASSRARSCIALPPALPTSTTVPQPI